MNGKLVSSGLSKDILVILISILVAIFLAQSGILTKIISSTKQLEFVGSLVAGIFFTSVFTVPLSVVALGEIARTSGILTVVLLGGLGAVIGDLIIFRFIRDNFSRHLSESMLDLGFGKRIGKLMELKYFRWFTFFLGGLIIASPLPDELGVALLGFSKMKLSWFIPVSFVFNSLGILLIAIVAKAI